MNFKFTRMHQCFHQLKYNGTPFYDDMEKRAFVLALALTLPLVLYGIPYAYAATTTSSYINTVDCDNNLGGVECAVHCNTGDFATGGGVSSNSDQAFVQVNQPMFFDGAIYLQTNTNGDRPNAWEGGVSPPEFPLSVWVVCQTPITVAGIGVPEFGSLYVAIALGAVIYFALSRQHAGKRSAGITKA
jgi:hypothetical protein